MLHCWALVPVPFHICLNIHLPLRHSLCSKFTRLRRLEVCGGSVTEAGAAHLAALTGLQHLSLAQVGGCGAAQCSARCTYFAPGLPCLAFFQGVT